MDVHPGRAGRSGNRAERSRARVESGLGADADPPRFVSVPIDRRRFLVVAGGAAAYLALRPHLAWARKVGHPLPPLQAWTLPAEPPEDPVELTRALVGGAILAPSHWNSQPWRFEVDDHTIRLMADLRRVLPATDPDRRWLMVSLGAALENLLVTARAYALMPSVRYLPHGEASPGIAEVTWARGETRRDRMFFAAIPRRRTNRRNFDGRGLFPENRAKINAQIPEGVRLHWILDQAGIRDMADLVRDAARAQVRDPAAQVERRAWMRFGDDDAREHGDGVSVDALELGGPARWFASRYFDPESWFLRFGAESAGKQARSQVRSSGAIALLTTTQPGELEWLKAGQTYERIALRCTQVGISHHPINAPIQQERFRKDLVRRFGAGNEHPLMLVRMGHAKRPRPTPRRAVALVTSFRQS